MLPLLTFPQTDGLLADKRIQVNELTASHAAVKEKHAELQTALNSSEELLQTLLTGLSSRKDGQTGGGYMGQLAEAKARLAQGTAEEEQSRVKLGMSERELKALQARWKEVEREAGEGRRQLDVMQAEVAKFRKKISESGWSAEKEQDIETALRNARAEVRHLTEVRIGLVVMFSSFVLITLPATRWRETTPLFP